MNKWENIKYQIIRESELSNNILIVRFANDDVVKVGLASILPIGEDVNDFSSISNNDYEVILSKKDSEIHVPWDKIRVLSDEVFAKEMVRKAEENAKLIGERIRNLREKKGLKANDLAQRSGITPQTISRIEKGHTDVSFATLRKILAAMGSTLKDLAQQEVIAENNKPILTFSELMRKFNSVGLDTNLVNKIIPKNVQQQANSTKGKMPELLSKEIGIYFKNVFGWSYDELFSGAPLVIKESLALSAHFKTPSRGNVSQIKAYSHYAYYLADALNSVNTEKPSLNYPGDIDEFRSQFYSSYKVLTLSNLVNYAWDMGIAVLPLNDQGVFHGACWNIKGKHVIVLKQKTQAHARWIFDLLHEFYHVFAHLENENTSIVELEEVNPFDNNSSIEEREANAFAGQFIFEDRAESMVAEVMELSHFKIDQIKKSVSIVAEKEKIPVDFLANYMAFRLQMSKQNWWATASTFQKTNPDPFTVTKEILLKRVRVEKLGAIENNLLTNALN